MLLVLACSGPSSQPLPGVGEIKGEELLRISGLDKAERSSMIEELRAREEKLHVLPSDSGELYVFLDANSSEDLIVLSGKGKIEKVEKKEMEKAFNSPEISRPESGSGSEFELPSIFDIFTRIY